MTSAPARDRAALETLRATRVGVWTTALDTLSPVQAGEHAAELEALGFGSLWFGEAYGREAFTNAGLLLSASERLVIGTGIANIYGRDAVTGSSALGRCGHRPIAGRARLWTRPANSGLMVWASCCRIWAKLMPAGGGLRGCHAASAAGENNSGS